MSWLLLLQGMGSQMHQLQQLWHMGSAVAAPRLWSTGSVVVAHGLSSSAACGIFPERDQTCVPCIAEKAMAPHSSTFAWKIHGWRSLVGCRPWGCEEADTTEPLHFHFSLSCIGEENGNPLQCSCLENPRDGESLVGCRLWGHTESDTTEVT